MPMHIHLSPRHLVLTAAIHSYVANKISHLEEMTEQILAAHVVLLHDETRTKKYVIKVHLAIPGPDIYAEDAEDDLYAAIDKVSTKLARLLRKRKTRIQEREKHISQLSKEGSKRGYKRR
ncbi:MAG: ribosome-associated translation inhibitor RaiA [Candidatus Xiphinematobacter sp.]|nr:MAG: ribosome-associated translation inhibitor RaiA [Candidatus Xiphinematobacter sp.]